MLHHTFLVDLRMGVIVSHISCHVQNGIVEKFEQLEAELNRLKEHSKEVETKFQTATEEVPTPFPFSPSFLLNFHISDHTDHCHDSQIGFQR